MLPRTLRADDTGEGEEEERNEEDARHRSGRVGRSLGLSQAHKTWAANYSS